MAPRRAAAILGRVAALVYAKKIKQPETAKEVVQTEFKVFDDPPPRLESRVTAQTTLGWFTILLGALVIALYATLKALEWSRFGGLHFGWFDYALGVLAGLAVLFFFFQTRHRTVPVRGTLFPATVFFRENKQMVELTLDEGDRRDKTTFAGPVPAGYGVTVSRQVFVEYAVDGTRYLGQGSLFPGDTPAMVRLEGDLTFTVVCDSARPTRAVLVTEYDYEAALGEAS